MSSEIIYHRVVRRLPAKDTGLAEDLFLVAVQIGSSNCYEYGFGNRNGRRSRSWSMLAAGTRQAVMERLIRIAADMESGMVKIGHASGHVKPESFIAGARMMLKADVSKYDGAHSYIDGWFSLSFYDKPYWDKDAINTSDLIEWVKLPLVAKELEDGGSINTFIKVSGPDIRR